MRKEGWWQRLLEAIEASGRSHRDISVSADLGPNYVGQLVKGGKAPSADKVFRLCDELGVSVTYIATGAEITAQSEKFIAEFESLPPESKPLALELLRHLAQGGSIAR